MIEIPLDVCNLILDALDDICDSDPDWPFWSINEADNRFYSPKYYNQRYRAKSFMACALICSTWHDHALELLYSTVQLETGIQCQLYLETLAAHPERANWARKLALYPKTYIPLLPLLTPGFLPRCSQLQIGLSMGDPSVGYPPHYFSNVLHPLLSRHPGIAVLRLGTSQWITVSRLLRLMGSMPALHTIDFMSSHVGPESMDLATAGVIKSANRTHAREAIVTMSALRPTHDHRRWSMFARAVGPVITQLELSWHLGLAAYRDIDQLLEPLTHFRVLVHLTLSANWSSFFQMSETYAIMLSRLPRQEHIHEMTLAIHMQPGELSEASIRHNICRVFSRAFSKRRWERRGGWTFGPSDWLRRAFSKPPQASHTLLQEFEPFPPETLVDCKSNVPQQRSTQKCAVNVLATGKKIIVATFKWAPTK